MRLQHLLSVALLGMGLAVSPILTPAVRADDAPKKEAPKGGHDPVAGLQHYRESLNKLTLTSEQTAKIDPLFADAKTKIEAAVKEGNGDKDATLAKMKPIYEELHKGVNALLTPDQLEQQKKMHEHKKKPAA